MKVRFLLSTFLAACVLVPASYAQTDSTRVPSAPSITYGDVAARTTWDRIEGKPATATRWPKWNEISSRPASFPPTSHNHDSRYLRLSSGGTIQSNLTVNGSITVKKGINVNIPNVEDGSSIIPDVYPRGLTVHSVGYSSSNYPHSQTSTSEEPDVFGTVLTVHQGPLRAFQLFGRKHYSNNDRYNDHLHFRSCSTDSPAALCSPWLKVISENREGKVGIGLTGTKRAQTTLHVGGDATATAWLKSSDKRLKDDIQSVDDSLGKLATIEGVTFHMKEDPDEERKLGVIAQDVQAVFPEAVRENDDGYLSVDYPSLVAPLINAVNELRERDQAREAENEALYEVIADLRQELDELRGKMNDE